MTYDIVGIGLGPFNLGLAALCHDIPQLTTAFIEQKDHFDWHPGLLLPGARLQVPFYADLVTLVQPQSKFSWFSFLQARKRLFRFGVQDNIFPLRREYNEYGQWVAGQLKGICFGHRCEEVHYDDEAQTYRVIVRDIKTNLQRTFHAKHLVIGIGTRPAWPSAVKKLLRAEVPNQALIVHAADYLGHRETLLHTTCVTVIGSGQSAAEVFQDLLSNGRAMNLDWFTRSPRFFPMETTPSAYEFASPDYRRYFYKLPIPMKEFILAGQDALYKGINGALLQSIYEQLYECALDQPDRHIALHPGMELMEVKGSGAESEGLLCVVRHQDTGQLTEHATGALVVATGYEPAPLDFLEGVRDRICYLPSGQLDVDEEYAIAADRRIFVQNADLHSHGFASADLSFGPYRNAVILNAILGRDHFRLERDTTFQMFQTGAQGNQQK